MLVLKRNVDEAIIIEVDGREIRIINVDHRTRLGIEADPDIIVVREELLKRDAGGESAGATS